MAMSELPYIPLFVRDFGHSTAHLTNEETGILIRLLCLCWETPGCSIPDDMRWIVRRMRCDVADYLDRVEPIVKEFFTRENGRIIQRRLRREWKIAAKLSEDRKNAGLKGAVSRWKLENIDK